MIAAPPETAASNGIALRMLGISKHFGPVQALRDVSLPWSARTARASPRS
jgi:ABC-type sugar transport system ATPase subunit